MNSFFILLDISPNGKKLDSKLMDLRGILGISLRYKSFGLLCFIHLRVSFGAGAEKSGGNERFG